MTKIPNLRNIMHRKNATIQQLSDIAGVSEYTVMSARKGKRIGLELAGCIVIALETRNFIKLKRGPRSEMSKMRKGIFCTL